MNNNYSLKQIKEGNQIKNVPVIPDIMSETHTISANTPDTLVFFLPTDRQSQGYIKDYQSGSQNLFKQNRGWILGVEIAVFDVDGKPIYETIINGGALTTRVQDFSKSVTKAKVTHKFGEYERLIDRFDGYVPRFPDIYELRKELVPAIPEVAGQTPPIPAVPAYPTTALLVNPNTKQENSFNRKGKLGYDYPGKGLFLSVKDQWTIEIKLVKKFEPSCYGMQIETRAITHRVVDGKV